MLPAHAGACSMIVSHLPGALGQDGSVVYALQEPDDARPGLVRLVHYSATGIAAGELRVDTEVADARVSAQGIDTKGNVWLAVRCGAHAGSERCDSLIELAPNGEVTRQLALPENAWPRFDATQGHFVVSRLERHGLAVVPYPPGTEKPDVRRFELPVAIGRFDRQTWTLGDDGAAAMAIESAGEISFLLYRPDHRLRAAPSFPGARPGRAFDDPEAVRLGHVQSMALGDDGTLFVSQYALAPDCEVYQPPSVAILDAEGDLVAVAPADGTIHAMRALDDELVVLQSNGQVLRLAYDGTRIEAWTPELGQWRRGEEDTRALIERAAAADRSAAPDEWLEVLAWAEPGKRERILGWLVEAGPSALDEARDELWQKLGARLCARHPRAAPTEALRRFARSQGLNKARWLETLVACYAWPPASAYAYAIEIAERGDRYEDHAEAAFEAWGYPRESLETLWREAVGPDHRPSSGRQLLRAFDQVVGDFDDRLERGPEAERGNVRQLLFETMRGANTYYYGLDTGGTPRIPAAWSRLIPAAETWAASKDPFTAATGRLLLVGHGAVPAPRGLPALIADAERDPPLMPWLMYALQQVVRDRAALEELPAEALEQLRTRALDSPARTRIELRADWGKLDDPYRWIFDLGGSATLSRLYERALEPDAPAGVRKRLLARVSQEPWALEPASMAHLLDQPWLGDRALFGMAWALLERLHQALEGSAVPLGRIVTARFRRLFLHAAEHHPSLSHARPHDVEGESLLRTLEVADVAELVERTPDGVRQWLWVIAAVGAWPEIEAAVEAELRDGPNAVHAAIALAPLRHSAFARAVARWTEGNPERQAAVRPLWPKLSDLAGPQALAWRAELARSKR